MVEFERVFEVVCASTQEDEASSVCTNASSYGVTCGLERIKWVFLGSILKEALFNVARRWRDDKHTGRPRGGADDTK